MACLNYIDFSQYDLIIINSSGGKDSLCAIWKIWKQAKQEGYPFDRIVVSHQELGDMEWKGTKELVKRQADYFGFKTYYSKRRDYKGYEEDLLEYVERRGMWPSSQQKWCTSDFKRGPGARVVTQLTKYMADCTLLYVFGFRADESPSRKKKEVYKINNRLTTQKRRVYEWLPIHDWTSELVWRVIRSEGLEYHPAYDLGMPRLSCCFCIFSPFDALVVAGRANPELLDRYIEVEKKIGHTFRVDFAIESVRTAIESGYEPKTVKDWVM